MSFFYFTGGFLLRKNQAFVSLQSKLVTQKAKPFVQTCRLTAAHPSTSFRDCLRQVLQSLPQKKHSCFALSGNVFSANAFSAKTAPNQKKIFPQPLYSNQKLWYNNPVGNAWFQGGSSQTQSASVEIWKREALRMTCEMIIALVTCVATVITTVIAILSYCKDKKE